MVVTQPLVISNSRFAAGDRCREEGKEGEFSLRIPCRLMIWNRRLIPPDVPYVYKIGP